MAVSQLRAQRKPSGSKYKHSRKKKQYELGRLPALTKMEPRRTSYTRTMGSHRKIKLLSIDSVNLFDPKSKTYAQAKIKTISGNPANRHFVRRNIMTKGAIVETDKGKARITSRPGQHGVANAVLISE